MSARLHRAAAPAFLVVSLVLTGASPPTSALDASVTASRPPSAQLANHAKANPLRWTDETPDAMIADARERGMAESATEADVLAAAFVIRALDARADDGLAEEALRSMAGRASGKPELASELLLLGRSLASDEGTDAGEEVDESLGVVSNVAVLGPFRDTGGGLDARDGPEQPGALFTDVKKRYDWGTVLVPWRAVPRHYVTAGGVPLDLFIFPRVESCSWIASAVTLPNPGPVLVRVASSGSVRVTFDGVDVARSEDVAASGLVDRVSAAVTASEGVHLLAAKVCTGALGDDGRVRLRVTDARGAPLRVRSSADLSKVTSSAPQPVTARKPFAVGSGTTPLSRTLAPRSKAMTPALDAAVARTLGGSDDTRSPRATGLLDDLASRGSATPDELALIGWISPSGANRGAALNQARWRATGIDPKARAFAERRLIAQRLGSHLVDWAVATADGVHLGHDDAEAVLMHALLADALSTDALRAGALRDLESYVSGHPEAPTALVRELVHLAATYDPSAMLAAREMLAARGFRGRDLVTALGLRSTAALAEAAKKAFDGNLEDADDGLAVAAALSNAGRHEDARRAYEVLAEWAPNRWEAWGGLAHELSIAGNDAREPLTAALFRARELAPGDAALRAEVVLREPKEANGRREPKETDATAHEDEKYLVGPNVFLSRRRGAPATGGVPDVADRELYWLRAVVLHPDRRVSQLIQYAREIVIPPRTQEDLVEDLPLEGDLTEILRARVYKKDGTIAFPTEQHDEGSRPEIRWPDLEAGDTVEVVVRDWTRGAVGGRGDAPFYFMDYAGASPTHPLLYNEVVVEAPKGSPLYLDVLHGDPDRKDEHDDGDSHVTRLIWDKPAVIPDEPLAPNLSEVAPLIVGSTFKDWAGFRAWYTGAIQGFTEPDDEVLRLAATLTKGKSTREGKLEALFNFVADDIRYVNFTSAEGWLPNRPQQLLARREGDCDDKALLLITLLKAVGIDAEEVMVQTRERGEPSVLFAKKAVIPLFDHGIAFLPGPGGGQYLDATSPESRLGPLPSMDARAPAFRIQAGPAEMTHLPSSSPEDHGSAVTWAIALHADGSAELAGEETSVGDAAFWLRTALTQPDARADYVRDHLVGPWLPTVVVDKKVDFNGNLPRGAAWVKYSAHAGGLARHEGTDLTVSIGQSQGLTSNLAPLVTRTLPVVLPPTLAPSHQERRVRLSAPPGFVWAELPPGGDENGGEFGRARLEIARAPGNGGSVVVTRRVFFDEDVIPAAKYEAWRGWLQRVDRLMHKQLRLVPAGRP